jgi:DNA (cytosine-5)-methyltransferase 1
VRPYWFAKSKRAQNVDDYETWLEGGVVPTLNAFDVGDGRAVVLIIDGTRVGDVRVYEDGIVPTVISRYGTGGGNVPMVFEPKSAFEENWAESEVKNALRANASKSSHAVVMPTLTAANNPSRSPQSTEVTAQVEIMQRVTNTVRRLTPTECERLQGFPDGWTDGQADSNRYKQMGNAVAVPVVNWIIERLIEETQ